ncbi:MAG: helix-turn-helix transcriptional regulator [Pseudomonadota bacterium]
MAEAAPIFGTMLKQWRAHRHCSQLELAHRAGTSQRHVSFLETGRANPSRGMVLALAQGLDVPLREQNTLLRSAGFSAAFMEGDLQADSHALFHEALQQIIAQQMPYPALVLDGRWNMVMANPATLKFFGLFVNPLEIFARIGNPTEFQIVRLCLHEEGLMPYIHNWEALIGSFLARARKALLANPKHPSLPLLIDEITTHPRAPKSWQTVWSTDVRPALEMEMSRGDDHYRMFTMLAHFGSPGDVTLDEMSVELFYPADENTRAKLIALA